MWRVLLHSISINLVLFSGRVDHVMIISIIESFEPLIGNFVGHAIVVAVTYGCSALCV